MQPHSECHSIDGLRQHLPSASTNNNPAVSLYESTNTHKTESLISLAKIMYTEAHRADRHRVMHCDSNLCFDFGNLGLRQLLLHQQTSNGENAISIKPLPLHPQGTRSCVRSPVQCRIPSASPVLAMGTVGGLSGKTVDSKSGEALSCLSPRPSSSSHPQPSLTHSSQH